MLSVPFVPLYVYCLWIWVSISIISTTVPALYTWLISLKKSHKSLFEILPEVSTTINKTLAFLLCFDPAAPGKRTDSLFFSFL